MKKHRAYSEQGEKIWGRGVWNEADRNITRFDKMLKQKWAQGHPRITPPLGGSP